MPIDLKKLNPPDIDMDRWLADRRKLHANRRIEAENKRRFLPFGNTLEYLVRAEAENRIPPQMKANILALAEQYARRNKRPFDGTLRDAIRLAGEADNLMRLHFEATPIRA